MENPKFEVRLSAEEYEAQKVAVGRALKTWLTNIEEPRNWRQINEDEQSKHRAQEPIHEQYDPEAEEVRRKGAEALLEYFDQVDDWLTDAKAHINELKKALKDEPIPEEESMQLIPFFRIAKLTPMKDIAQFILQELQEKRVFFGITPTRGNETIHIPDAQSLVVNDEGDTIRYIRVIDQFDPYQCWKDDRDHIWAYAPLYNFYDQIVLEANSPLKRNVITPQDVSPQFIELDYGFGSDVMYITSFPDLANKHES